MNAIFFLFLGSSVFGQFIQTPSGFRIRTGVNLAIWLSQTEKRGQERGRFISEKDIALLAGLGFDHVRLPIGEVRFWDDAGNREDEAFKLMHNAIGWSLKNGLRVIIDLHIIRSHYFNAASNVLWTDPADQASDPVYFREVQWPYGYWDKAVMPKDIAVTIESARKPDLPLYCSESGVYYTAPKEDALRWYSDLTDIFRGNKIACRTVLQSNLHFDLTVYILLYLL